MVFDFWDDYITHKENENASRPSERRNESESDARIREAFLTSWWAEDWWYSFILVPLAEKFGYKTVLKFDLPKVFKMRSAVSEQNQIEGYWHWMWEKENDSKDPNKQSDSKYMKNNTKRSSKKEVDQAMMNPDNFLSYITSKGYGVDNVRHIQQKI